MKLAELFINFIQETLNRLFSKSPKYFRIWQTLLVIVAALIGLPEFLSLFSFIHLPEWAFTFASTTGAWATIASLFLSKLVVKDINPETMKITGE